MITNKSQKRAQDLIKKYRNDFCSKKTKVPLPFFFELLEWLAKSYAECASDRTKRKEIRMTEKRRDYLIGISSYIRRYYAMFSPFSNSEQEVGKPDKPVINTEL